MPIRRIKRKIFKKKRKKPEKQENAGAIQKK